MIPILSGNVASAIGGAYEVANSCRFNSASSSYLHRTPSATGNPKKFTYSLWVKMAKENPGNFMVGGSSSNSYFIFGAYGGGDIDLVTYTGYVITATTGRLFRDPSAWYHVVLACDTTQASFSDGIKLYINGVLETSLATQSVGSENGYTQDTSLRWGTSGEVMAIGANSLTSQGFWDGYIAECAFVNDQQLAPTEFGEFDEDSPRIWKPKDISGLTFGTNGFYLDFKDSSNLGNDVSGNGNDFTSVNLDATDQATDTPTNNFATANPLANLVGAPTYSQGNLEITGDSSANHNWQSTIGLSSGKWYWEMKSTASSPDTGLMFYDQSITSQNHAGEGFATSGRLKIINNSTTGSAIGSTAQNDIHGMALDLDNGKMWIHRNGTYIESGDPAGNSNPFIETSDGLESEGVIGGFSYNGTVQINFGGCPPFSISSGNADANGYGNFEYAPPSGFYALCTKNLAEYGG